jgi:hypothetical protein
MVSNATRSTAPFDFCELLILAKTNPSLFSDTNDLFLVLARIIFLLALKIARKYTFDREEKNHQPSSKLPIQARANDEII